MKINNFKKFKKFKKWLCGVLSVTMLLGVSNIACAKEPEIEENLEIGMKFEMEVGDIEINLPDNDVIAADKNMSVDD